VVFTTPPIWVGTAQRAGIVNTTTACSVSELIDPTTRPKAGGVDLHCSFARSVDGLCQQIPRTIGRISGIRKVICTHTHIFGTDPDILSLTSRGAENNLHNRPPLVYGKVRASCPKTTGARIRASAPKIQLASSPKSAAHANDMAYR
jgi:hypothetical protein